MRIGLVLSSFLFVVTARPQESPDVLKRIEFERAPAIVLSNDKIALTLLETGGSMINLVLKDDAAQLSPFWNPARIARDAGKPTRSAGGGHFVCVDGFGSTSEEERSAGMPGHGEAHGQPWIVRSATKKDRETRATFSAHLPLVQEEFRRTFQIVDGESVVYVESELESLLAFDRPVNWAEHATIGAPFLAPGNTVVDMSARRSKTRGHNDEENPYPHRLANFADFTWPLAPGQNGGVVDIRNAPLKPNSLDHTTSLMDPDRKLVFVTALNLEHHLLIGYVFRREEYPWLQNWESYPPDMGGARGLEFSTQPFDIPRREVIERGPMFGAPVLRWLPAKSKIGSRFLFFYTRVPPEMVRIDDVSLDRGELTIEDKTSKQRVTLAASLGL
jgi:hypothetical protein